MWLVRRCRSIAGRLEVARREQRELDYSYKLKSSAVANQIASLEQDLDSIHTAIRLHEVEVDPTKLGALRVQTKPRRNGYGHMSSALLETLAAVFPESLTTDELAARVMANCNFVPVAERYDVLRDKVRKRLRGLVVEGRVNRLHPASGSELGRWCLSEKSALLLCSGTETTPHLVAREES
jgi:hypothetical protein